MREMGRKGGKKGGPKGGKARMEALTPKERQELARKAGKQSGLVRRKEAEMRRIAAKKAGKK